jgi:hypothetical protein
MDSGDRAKADRADQVALRHTQLKEKMVGTQHNEVANWLKHPSGPPTATISELEALAMIQRAILKYSATYNGATTNMQNFLAGQEARLRGKA